MVHLVVRIRTLIQGTSFKRMEKNVRNDRLKDESACAARDRYNIRFVQNLYAPAAAASANH